MSDTAWVLKGIEPAARQQAIDEAARRGVSLGDHLTDIVLQNALAAQMRGQARPLLGEACADTDIHMPSEEPREAFAIRHRLKALEKRLSASVGSIDGTLHALDGALFDLTARIGDVEALAGDSAHNFAQALKELHANLAALRIQLEDAEAAAARAGETNQSAHLELADACGELDQRIDGVERVARNADGAAASLALEHEALRQAVADDLDALAHQTTERLGEGLAQVRAAADAAARHADAAAANLVNELRELRQAIDARLEDSLAETKSRMHAAFAEAADRMATLADRVLDGERAQMRTAEQLRGEISNVEDATQTALEETAESLRRADARLGAELIRSQEATQADLSAVQAELAREADDMRERHLGALARLAQVENALHSATDETEELRNSIAIRIAALSAGSREALAQAEVGWRQSLESLAARVRASDDKLEDARHTLSADTQRVEACTLAALEKLNTDRVAGDGALARDLDGVFTAMRASIADARQSFETDNAALRGQHAAMQARLDVVDTALTAITPLQISVAEIPALKAMAGRVAALEGLAADMPATKAATEAIATLQTALARIEAGLPDRGFEIELGARMQKAEHAIASFKADDANARLRTQLDALAAQLAAQQDDTPARLAAMAAKIEALAGEFAAQRHAEPPAIAALRTQIANQSSALAAQGQVLAAREDASSETAVNLENVARMLTRLSTRSVEAETQAQERLHKLEVGFADLRLGQLAATDHADRASIETIAIINARIADMESRSAGALAEIHAQIAAFLADNETRLEAIEQAPSPALPERPFAQIEARLDELELRDLGAEFIELRRRIDDRILGLEQRSINALERVCDSVALIEQRLLQSGPDRDVASA